MLSKEKVVVFDGVALTLLLSRQKADGNANGSRQLVLMPAGLPT
jgi:hypothetical protein